MGNIFNYNFGDNNMEINITTKLNLGDIVYRIMLGNLEKHIITEINIKEIKGRELVQYKTDKTIFEESMIGTVYYIDSDICIKAYCDKLRKQV